METKEIRKNLWLDYGGMIDGEQRTGELCPFCSGGRTGERTFSVRREGNSLLYNCFRASCGKHGSTTKSGRPADKAQGQERRGVSETSGVQLYRDSGSLTEDGYEYLEQRYGIERSVCDRHGIRYEPRTGRFVLPVRNPENEVVGVVLRKWTGTTSQEGTFLPKAQTLGPRGSVACYALPESSACVVVEDIFSAIRVNKYHNSAALLGVVLNESKLEKIKKLSSNIYICLDADAFPTAVKLALKYKLKVVKLTKDFKDMGEEELQEFLKENIK